ncbi:MAG: lytic transglycosylase domain-containing protein [Oscillospiraceae bacterium]|jgi:soluble lytic murein transglycosylase|nr:lytic transglycosylase domain-containing protein [Oscillospiraceae bacterium]
MKVNKNKPDALTVIIRVLVILIVVSVILLAVNIVYSRFFDDENGHQILFSEFVEKSAEDYGIDKFLIYAVIKTESNFNPEAVSEVGARGLMQLMPDTFEWIRDFRKGEDLDFDDMFDPEDNIRYGTYLLSYHMRYYEDIDCSLAAYHAGDGNVDKWLENAEYSSDGKTLDVIPIPDTRHYVNKVKKAYEIYKKLYGGND